ncbi:MAG: hypothetical protein PHQ20_04250 [Candidatus Moranbacteria bacterium]|nr:hypothetical protein [Candidatus Moranbacteria bacterium]
MKKLDVLLVLPPMYQSGRVSDYNPKEPMGLMYLSSTLKEHSYSVEILDADILALTIEETVDEIVKKPAMIIGFSKPTSHVSKFSSNDLAEKIYSILFNKKFCTFPEHYRWNND